MFHSLLFIAVTAVIQTPEPALICCGAEEVFIVSQVKGEPNKWKRTWSWQATDSPSIPLESRKWFESTDDCKPYGETILITSSSGGVALVNRVDKKCRFLAHAKNAHSACLLPENRTAVASSFGGNEVLIYDIPKELALSKPIGSLPLEGAHGVVWDHERNQLWGLGEEQLLLLSLKASGDAIKLSISNNWKLPTRGGHDLSTTGDDNQLFITTNAAVYRFDKTTGEFSLDTKLGEEKIVKSVSRFSTGEVVYHQGSERKWWSHTIRFVGDRKPIELPDERLYKIRWDVPLDWPTAKEK